MLSVISVLVIFGYWFIATGVFACVTFQVRIRSSALVATILFASTIPFQKLIAAIWMGALYHA